MLATDVARVLGVEAYSEESSDDARDDCRLDPDAAEDARDVRVREGRVEASVGASRGGETRRFLTFLLARTSALLRLHNASTSRELGGGNMPWAVTLMVGAPARGICVGPGTARRSVVTRVEDPAE